MTEGLKIASIIGAFYLLFFVSVNVISKNEVNKRLQLESQKSTIINNYYYSEPTKLP